MSKMYEKIASLPIAIENYELESHNLTVVGGNNRHTTVIALSGKGQTGRGEDVTYDTGNQLQFQANGKNIDFEYEGSLGGFCDLISAVDLFPDKPKDEVYRRYRRWAFESAALDLALRQAGKSLAEFLEINPKPVHFVVSQRLGNPSRIDLLRERLQQYPDLKFKLDPTNDWSDELIEQLSETGAVESLDLKGFYKGTPVDVRTDPELYKKLLQTFPKAWFEDPDVSDETKDVLDPYADKITWDAPLHEAKDILNMPYRPKFINVKPSRFGSLEELFKVYELCSREGIGMYGGGQFELSVGRAQNQYLASLFHPDSANDVSPAEYHVDVLPNGLPSSILGVADVQGFSPRLY
jgi:L-alanine-DL-glutamate epimerase-like enolase superfamily enzyme